MKDLWLVGDKYLKEMYYTLRALKKTDMQHRGRAMDNSPPEPCLHRQYNVKSFNKTEDYAKDNVLVRTINALEDAM